MQTSANIGSQLRRLRRMFCAVALAALALVAAKAHAERAPRFHLATPKLQQRLARNTEVGRNLDAVAHYRRANGRTGGTAFLLTRPNSRGVALALTNHHVALYDKKTVKGDSLLFHRGGKARPTRAQIVDCLASDQRLDFALLAVKLPRKLRDLAPVSLTRRGERGVGAVYNAGFPRIWQAERKRHREGKPSLVAVGPSRATREAFHRGLRARKLWPKMVQVGRVNREMWVEPLITLRLANESGSSGSPIFDRRDHRVIGMLSAGGGNVDAFAMPIAPILKQVASQVRRIGDPTLRRAVKRLLQTGHSDPAPAVPSPH